MKAKHQTSGPSLTEALRDMLECGAPTNSEVRAAHFGEIEARASMPALVNLTGMRGGGKALHVPLGMLKRDVGVGSAGGASLVGQRLERVSDLLSWSACVQAGALILTNLRENISLARTSKLPEPEWVPEVGFAPGVDPEFG